MNKTLITLSLLIAGSTTAWGYEHSKVSVKVPGVGNRSMEVYTPDTKAKDLPLMIVTHGMNQDPEYQSGADKMYEMIDKEQFYICYLRSSGTTWDISGTNDQKFVEQAIVQMYSQYDIDPHRVYWTGFSMGSMLMYHCMDQMQGKIAAFAPTSGVQFSEQPWNKCKRPVNLIHCHSYKDDVFAYTDYASHDYVENMAKMNNYTDYVKTLNYCPAGALTGDKEVWTNAAGNVVELFSYNGGGHWPQEPDSHEIWNFCKQFSLADDQMDAITKIDLNATYTYQLKEEDEVINEADKLHGKTLLVTDKDLQTIWYVNSGNESPQNVCSGFLEDIANNPYCYLKFTKVTDAKCKTTGNLYTAQLADEYGNTYALWGKDGYLNTPPGTWCLFALGLTKGYGEDAQNYGLWQVSYEEGKGYVMVNVGASEAGENAYAVPSATTPQAAKAYVRMFKKATEVSLDAIEYHQPADARSYDLQGRVVSQPRQNTIVICNGKKTILR